ncbi:MAG: hypothetical protein AB7O28_25295 [Vicinamibacterales bacterium]
MSTDVAGWLMAFAVLTQGAPCAPEALALADRAAALVARGDDAEADRVLRAGYAEAAGCADVVLAAWSWQGWLAARRAEPAGGRPEDLAPAADAAARLAALGGATSPAAYAAAVVRAAEAAAQDEREEMALWLDHAHEISRRLALGAAAPRWPLPIDSAEGVLWLAVDDYEEALAAFERAVTDGGTPVAWLGLARAMDGLGRHGEACAALRRAAGAAGPSAATGPAAAAAGDLLRTGCP